MSSNKQGRCARCGALAEEREDLRDAIALSEKGTANFILAARRDTCLRRTFRGHVIDHRTGCMTLFAFVSRKKRARVRVHFNGQPAGCAIEEITADRAYAETLLTRWRIMIILAPFISVRKIARW